MPKNILIVEENPAVRATIRRLLAAEAGFCICGESADGVDAITKARDLRPDLVLLGISMPKLNGAVAASIIKKELPGVYALSLKSGVRDCGKFWHSLDTWPYRFCWPPLRAVGLTLRSAESGRLMAGVAGLPWFCAASCPPVVE